MSHAVQLAPSSTNDIIQEARKTLVHANYRLTDSTLPGFVIWSRGWFSVSCSPFQGKGSSEALVLSICFAWGSVPPQKIICLYDKLFAGFSSKDDSGSFTVSLSTTTKTLVESPRIIPPGISTDSETRNPLLQGGSSAEK